MLHEFVENIPDKLAQDTLYVSIEYATAVHKCACGCGHEVVTPFSPTDWSLSFDGKTVSLSPSIGNWSFPCRSHYLVKKGRVVWVGSMSPSEIAAGRARDNRNKEAQYSPIETKAVVKAPLTGWRALVHWLIG
jgi:hypothetical protein